MAVVASSLHYNAVLGYIVLTSYWFVCHRSEMLCLHYDGLLVLNCQQNWSFSWLKEVDGSKVVADQLFEVHGIELVLYLC